MRNCIIRLSLILLTAALLFSFQRYTAVTREIAMAEERLSTMQQYKEALISRLSTNIY